jgi:hypothetical protein
MASATLGEADRAAHTGAANARSSRRGSLPDTAGGRGTANGVAPAGSSDHDERQHRVKLVSIQLVCTSRLTVTLGHSNRGPSGRMVTDGGGLIRLAVRCWVNRWRIGSRSAKVIRSHAHWVPMCMAAYHFWRY